MTSEPFNPRNTCPLCGSVSRKHLTRIPPEVFVDDNPTIDQERLEVSGLLDLPFIDLVRCDNCEFCYTAASLSPEWASCFWSDVYIADNSQAKILKATKRLRNVRIWAQLAELLFTNHVADGGTLNLLDFGCGWGDFLLTAQTPGVRVIGIEISPPKVEFATHHGIEIYASLEDIPDDVTFHAFHCDQVFEHLREPAEALKGIAKRLHPEFVGFVAVPNYAKTRIDSLATAINSGERVRDKDLITWDHLNFFSPETFSEFLSVVQMAPITLPNGYRSADTVETCAFVRSEAAIPREPTNEVTVTSTLDKEPTLKSRLRGAARQLRKAIRKD